MKGRTVWALIAMVMLSVPLLSLVVVWLRAPLDRHAEGWSFSPWMSSREFRAQRDLLKPCQEDAQCSPPLECFHEPDSAQGYCTASECYSDRGRVPGHSHAWQA